MSFISKTKNIMSHVTITTTVGKENTTDKPNVDVLANDNNRRDDLTTHKHINSSNFGNDFQTNTRNVNLTNDLHNTQTTQNLDTNHPHDFGTTTHNISSTNDYYKTPNTQDVNIKRSHDYDKNTHNVNLTNVVPQTHTSSQQYQDVNVGTHGQSHEYDNVHNKDIRSPLLGNDVGSTNLSRNYAHAQNIETDANRKDNWITPDNVKKTDVNDTDHHRHNKDVLITSNDSNLKKDNGHGYHEHHHLHDTNTTNVNYNTNPSGTSQVHSYESNQITTHQNPIIISDNTHKTSGDHPSQILVDTDPKKRNLTYDTNPTFANDVGTTGLLGNNLGNNLIREAGPDTLVPRGVNKNADWTGHVPDPHHPKHDNLENIPNDNKKL